MSSSVIWLQECKRPAERSLNVAVDGGFMDDDLRLLCAVSLPKEDPVYANRANLLKLVTQAENKIVVVGCSDQSLCMWSLCLNKVPP